MMIRMGSLALIRGAKGARKRRVTEDGGKEEKQAWQRSRYQMLRGRKPCIFESVERTQPVAHSGFFVRLLHVEVACCKPQGHRLHSFLPSFRRLGSFSQSCSQSCSQSESQTWATSLPHLCDVTQQDLPDQQRRPGAGPAIPMKPARKRPSSDSLKGFESSTPGQSHRSPASGIRPARVSAPRISKQCADGWRSEWSGRVHSGATRGWRSEIDEPRAQARALNGQSR
ncbi:hypothetical protein V8C26DRAFT_109444 [Trichoderma gracile]